MERCAWVNLKNPKYVEYHDHQWGVPVHEDSLLFEMLVLEGAQAGLSWETILNKRENYRAAFKNFDAKKISKFTEDDIERLLNNEGIVRNRLKIRSAIQNAHVFLKIQKEFGSFDRFIWGYVNNQTIYVSAKSLSELPTQDALSDKISKELKSRGMTFVGSTIIYSYLLAIGIIHAHTTNCFCYKAWKNAFVLP